MAARGLTVVPDPVPPEPPEGFELADDGTTDLILVWVATGAEIRFGGDVDVDVAAETARAILGEAAEAAERR